MRDYQTPMSHHTWVAAMPLVPGKFTGSPKAAARKIASRIFRYRGTQGRAKIVVVVERLVRSSKGQPIQRGYEVKREPRKAAYGFPVGPYDRPTPVPRGLGRVCRRGTKCVQFTFTTRARKLSPEELIRKLPKRITAKRMYM